MSGMDLRSRKITKITKPDLAGESLIKRLIMSIQEEIRQQIETNPIVLYMKGTPDFPQCSFSGRVVHILRQCGAYFTSFNVLESSELRQGIKDFSNWPTIPQLYINGEFIGGSDIVSELFKSGELTKLLEGL